MFDVPEEATTVKPDVTGVERTSRVATDDGEKG